jgi:ferredoxin-NADP reductase
MSARAPQSEAERLIDARVTAIRPVARDINVYHLAPIDGMAPPPASAGAHIDVHLPNGMTRQYSLVLDNQAPYYVIAVKLDPQSRGGSVHIHEHCKIGDTLRISAPRNHFPLNEEAPHTVLIAGGIGITPIFSMVQRLRLIRKPYALFYATRARAEAAFLDALPASPQIHLHFDDERGDAHMDLNAIVAHARSNAHFYCCGPLPMMAAFESAAAALPAEQIHVEYFTPKEAPALAGGFVVRLARSGMTLEVPEGRTILDVVEEAGVMVEHSCTEGICGTCETRVIEGIPDHRDSVLLPAERAANTTMMICCSGSKTKELVLDL